MVEDLKKLLEKVNKSNELTLFFTNLWKEYSSQAKLFFLHRGQLFPPEDKIVFPYIFWSNVEEEDERTTDVLDILEELEEIKRKRAWNGLGFKNLLNGMKDIFAYYSIKVMRSNDDLKKLILDQTFSYRKMKKTLGNYEKINLDVLDQEEIESVPELFTIVKNNAIRFMKAFDFTKLFEAISSISGITSTLPLKGIPHLETIREIAEMDFYEYGDIIRELYVLKLISNFQTLFWCQHCLDHPQVFVTTSRIDPDRLKMECLKCKKQMRVSSIYNIDDLLKECIMYKDGLLAVALGWLFNERNIEWNFSVQNKYENDFICETKGGKVLFECKMHLIPKDERSLEGQLKQDLNMLITHVQTLSKEGTHPSKVYLVYNYDLASYPSDDVKKILNLSKLRKGITQHKIEVIGFPEVISVLETEGFGNQDFH